MSRFCSGKCSRFPRCTLFLCLPTAKAASLSATLRGLLSFGALITCLERFFLLYWINLSLGIVSGNIFYQGFRSILCCGVGCSMVGL